VCTMRTLDRKMVPYLYSLHRSDALGLPDGTVREKVALNVVDGLAYLCVALIGERFDRFDQSDVEGTLRPSRVILRIFSRRTILPAKYAQRLLSGQAVSRWDSS
jgi:hypothetical protein